MSLAVADVSFEQLAINPALICKVREKGYGAPTPIQAKSIPVLLSGQDLLGQAQTGTGKTAAFALPLLSKIDCRDRTTQVLVLTPTRELAIQVAEAFREYGARLDGLRCTPIYGGQSMRLQLDALQRGVQVVVGTPGRVLDHVRRKSLDLSKVRSVVLDEADEMLKMGFVEDIETILGHTPPEKQVALFSATMPNAIRRIAAKHLKNEEQIHIASKTSTVETTKQYYWLVQGLHKLDALTRLLEAEEIEAVLVFAATKTGTVELGEKLEARGYPCAVLNGDLSQQLRERIVRRLKKGEIKIIVATDVAARGLDVDCISHVINYDLPNDTESYVHRIGRTGRAGRSGKAILFVSPRERRGLQAIERATRQRIEPLQLPGKQQISAIRIKRFKDKVAELLAGKDLGRYADVISQLAVEQNTTPLAVASALCLLVQRELPLFFEETPRIKETRRDSEDAPAGVGEPWRRGGIAKKRGAGKGKRPGPRAPRKRSK